METGSQRLPFLTVIQPRIWTENRFYRLYVLPQELVFVWAGNASDVARGIVGGGAAGGGLAGGLIGGGLAAAIKPGRKKLQREEELQAKSFQELRDDHEYNFELRIDKIESARIVRAGFWFKFNHLNVQNSGLLRIKPTGNKELVLAICTADDASAAIGLLSPVLGPKLTPRSD